MTEELKPIDVSKYNVTETGQVLKTVKEFTDCQDEGKRKHIAELEKENANLKALRKYELNVSKLEIEKLEKENTELKDKLNNLSKVAEVRLANWQKYEQENAELKAKLKPENCLKLLAKEGYIKSSSEQLTKAKELIEDLIKFQPYINREAFFISLGNKWKTAIYKAENFLKENNNEQSRT